MRNMLFQRCWKDNNIVNIDSAKMSKRFENAIDHTLYVSREIPISYYWYVKSLLTTVREHSETISIISLHPPLIEESSYIYNEYVRNIL